MTLLLLLSVLLSAIAMVGTLAWALDKRADAAVAILRRQLDSARLHKTAIMDLAKVLVKQMARECEQRDATINALRGELHTVYAAIGELREPGRGTAPTVPDAAIEDLQEITTWVWPGCDYSSNAQAGDGDPFCRGCGESVAEPHRFDQCARVLRSQVDHFLDAEINGDLDALCAWCKRIRDEQDPKGQL